jgi:hypothetical protein
MKFHDGRPALTVANATITTFADGTYWPIGTWPYDSGTTYYQWPWLSAPTCSGDVHVFACEHATKCKCGTASRNVAAPKCGICGK